LSKREIEIGSNGDYTISDDEAEQLSNKLIAKDDVVIMDALEEASASIMIIRTP
jgi:hypothetical protein